MRRVDPGVGAPRRQRRAIGAHARLELHAVTVTGAGSVPNLTQEVILCTHYRFHLAPAHPHTHDWRARGDERLQRLKNAPVSSSRYQMHDIDPALSGVELRSQPIGPVGGRGGVT